MKFRTDNMLYCDFEGDENPDFIPMVADESGEFKLDLQQVDISFSIAVDKLQEVY